MSDPSQHACDGPVYFADQGIEVCESCGGCTCCEYVNVNHERSRFWCWPGHDGVCHLRHEHSNAPSDTPGGPLRSRGEVEDE